MISSAPDSLPSCEVKSMEGCVQGICLLYELLQFVLCPYYSRIKVLLSTIPPSVVHAAPGLGTGRRRNSCGRALSPSSPAQLREEL